LTRRRCTRSKPTCDEYFLLALGAFGAAVFRVFLFENVVIASASMEPTLPVGRTYWVNKSVYRWGAPRRGELIVFQGRTDKKEWSSGWSPSRRHGSLQGQGALSERRAPIGILRAVHPGRGNPGRGQPRFGGRPARSRGGPGRQPRRVRGQPGLEGRQRTSRRRSCRSIA
jgi:hypothetical protein